MNIWLDMAKRELEESKAEGSGLIITDVRFPNEHRWTSQNGGLVVHVRRDGTQHKIGETGHESEAGLKHMAQDWVTPYCTDLAHLEIVADQITPFVQIQDVSETAVRPGFPNFEMVYGDKANG